MQLKADHFEQPGGQKSSPDTIESGCVGCKEAARILGLSHKTLNNWRVQGLGPRFLKYGQRGGAVRYLVADLHAWRAAQARSSTSSI
jgi:hypothetical protein